MRICWSNESQTLETKNKRNTGSKTVNVPKAEDLEHKLVVNEYLELYKTYKEGTKAWTENIGKCCYLSLQHCPPELKTKLKNSARWETVTTNTDVVALLLMI